MNISNKLDRYDQVVSNNVAQFFVPLKESDPNEASKNYLNQLFDFYQKGEISYESFQSSKLGMQEMNLESSKQDLLNNYLCSKAKNTKFYIGTDSNKIKLTAQSLSENSATKDYKIVYFGSNDKFDGDNLDLALMDGVAQIVDQNGNVINWRKELSGVICQEIDPEADAKSLATYTESLASINKEIDNVDNQLDKITPWHFVSNTGTSFNVQLVENHSEALKVQAKYENEHIQKQLNILKQFELGEKEPPSWLPKSCIDYEINFFTAQQHNWNSILENPTE